MIPRWLPLPLAVVLLWLDALHAQKPTQIGINPFYRDTTASINYNKMYEDIEIMRCLLDRKLHGIYPSHTYQSFGMVGMQGGIGGMRGGMGMGMAGGMMPVTVPMRSLEGVYLKGQGVVYTATVASLQPPAKAGSDTSSPKRYAADVLENEWESIRRQIRNEKEKPTTPEASKPPSLSDVLLKMMAENGHNFSQLGENESLTLVLTVHSASSLSPAAKSGGGSAKTEPKSTANILVSDLIAQVRDNELLGELHLKQGKHEEAIKAFHYVLKRISDPKREAELHRKLAQCYLMQGDDEKARAELDQAIALVKKETEAKAKPASTAKPATTLPIKLIISAPKKLLDQAEAGKITFEEFRRQAHVETLRFDGR